MKKLMEQMAEELSAAFEKSGYDPSYGKVQSAYPSWRIQQTGSLRISVQRCYGRSQSIQEGTVYDR